MVFLSQILTAIKYSKENRLKETIKTKKRLAIDAVLVIDVDHESYPSTNNTTNDRDLIVTSASELLKWNERLDEWTKKVQEKSKRIDALRKEEAEIEDPVLESLWDSDISKETLDINERASHLAFFKIYGGDPQMQKRYESTEQKRIFDKIIQKMEDETERKRQFREYQKRSSTFSSVLSALRQMKRLLRFMKTKQMLV